MNVDFSALANRLLRRWRAIVHGEALDHDLDEEMRFHVEAESAELIRLNGLPPEEARRRALVTFGGLTQTRETHREARGVAWFDTIRLNIRYAWRSARHRPGFAAAVVLTIAMGVGANAATFSVVDRLLFRPPPMLRQPSLAHRVHLVYNNPELDHVHWDGVPYASYLDVTNSTRSFARIALYTNMPLVVGRGADARELPVGEVSPSFFGFFDAAPTLGRYFSAQEDGPPSGTSVAVLSYAMWQSAFAGASDILGARLQIGPTVYTIVGVSPKGFAGIWPEDPPVAFIPVWSWAAGTQHGDAFGRLVVQRKPDVTVAAAEAELTEVLDRTWDRRHGWPQPRAIVGSILDGRAPAQADVARVAALVGGMAMIVLLIAAANVANLLLARMLSRRSEIAARLALGASRGRLLSQVLTESTLLAVLGGFLGLVAANWGGPVLGEAVLPQGARFSMIGDPRTLAFTSFVVLTVGLLVGLVPAWQAGRVDPVRHLKTRAHGEGRATSWIRAALLACQAALSVLLLVGAGLFVRSLSNVRHLPLGYDAGPVLGVQVNMRGVTLDSAEGEALRQRLLLAAQRLPDVEHASLALTLPLRAMIIQSFEVPGIDSASMPDPHAFLVNAVSPDYFATMGTRILRGRGIEPSDVASAPGAIVVSRTFAKLVWRGKDPIGQCVKVGGHTEPCSYVVGVAEDIKHKRLIGDPGLDYYVSAAQYSDDYAREHAVLVARVRGEPAREREVVRRALQQEMPRGSFIAVTPLADIVDGQMRSWQLGTRMFLVFGVLALALAAIGLYGVISYTVTRRMHEIGVRMVLGAKTGDVLWLGLRQGLLVAGLGTVIGLAVALATAPVAAPLMFNESPRDPLVYALVVCVMLGVAAVASIIPAGRAAGLDPNMTLRSE